MSDPVSGATSLSQIMADIDLGPTGSVQFMFAKLQLAQSEICKNQATDYMRQIEEIQAEQKECAEMIALARDLQQKAKNGDGVGVDTIKGMKNIYDHCYPMPQEVVDYMDKRGLSYPNSDNDYNLGHEEWDYTLKSLTNYQEQIGTKTQTLMVYLQDFIGQYNSYLQGANTQIANANQTLTNIARGQ
ncbi:USH1C-binding protein 1 [Mailhella sp.]|uniref:USH1C-binding protein 1 n=1 Tax=Mailhella sp. TaxID=1981029 RepID=UPI0040636091